MPRNILQPSLLLLIALFSLQCRRSNEPTISSHPAELIYTGKLVISGPCSQYVIQVPAGEVDSSLVTTNWKDRSTDSVYTTVFTVTDYCTFASYNLSKGDSISFMFAANPPVQTCVRCDIYVPTPPASDAVINVTKITTQ